VYFHISVGRSQLAREKKIALFKFVVHGWGVGGEGRTAVLKDTHVKLGEEKDF